MTGIAAVVVAGGQGLRARTSSKTESKDGPAQYEQAKQYRQLGAKRVVCHSLDRFLNHPLIGTVVLVVASDVRPELSSILGTERLERLTIVEGGATRQQSVFAGLKALQDSETPDYVLIHDAARPLLSDSLLERILTTVLSKGSAVPGLRPMDAIKEQTNQPDGLMRAGQRVARDHIVAVQTPQAFSFAAIWEAHCKARQSGLDAVDDDAALLFHSDNPPLIVEGDPANIKLTTQQDFLHAARLLGYGQLPDLRIGTGYDLHRFADADSLKNKTTKDKAAKDKTAATIPIGGVQIPHKNQLVGHSDADCLLHALVDALLGALADGDIGTHFPPQDDQWKGADSAVFIADTRARLEARGGSILNIDSTIICEAPKIGPHRAAIQKSIAGLLGISPSRISIKAKTNEGLDAIGRGQGIAAQVAVLVAFPMDNPLS